MEALGWHFSYAVRTDLDRLPSRYVMMVASLGQDGKSGDIDGSDRRIISFLLRAIQNVQVRCYSSFPRDCHLRLERRVMRRMVRTLLIFVTVILFMVGSITGCGLVRTETTNAMPAATTSAVAKTPAEAMKLLDSRIVARDLDGIIALEEPEAAIVGHDGSITRGRADIRAFYAEWFKSDPVLTVSPRQTVIAGGSSISGDKVIGRTATIMGDYVLEQTRADGTRERFTGKFCTTVGEQPDGTWLYVLDNPYPP